MGGGGIGEKIDWANIRNVKRVVERIFDVIEIRRYDEVVNVGVQHEAERLGISVRIKFYEEFESKTNRNSVLNASNCPRLHNRTFAYPFGNWSIQLNCYFKTKVVIQHSMPLKNLWQWRFPLSAATSWLRNSTAEAKKESEHRIKVDRIPRRKVQATKTWMFAREMDRHDWVTSWTTSSIWWNLRSNDFRF